MIWSLLFVLLAGCAPSVPEEVIQQKAAEIARSISEVYVETTEGGWLQIQVCLGVTSNVY